MEKTRIILRELDGQIEISSSGALFIVRQSREMIKAFSGSKVDMSIDEIYSLRIQLEDVLRKMAFLEFALIGIDTSVAMSKSGWNIAKCDEEIKLRAIVCGDDGKMVGTAIVFGDHVVYYKLCDDGSFARKEIGIKDYYESILRSGHKYREIV